MRDQNNGSATTLSPGRSCCGASAVDSELRDYALATNDNDVGLDEQTVKDISAYPWMLEKIDCVDSSSDKIRLKLIFRDIIRARDSVSLNVALDTLAAYQATLTPEDKFEAEAARNLLFMGSDVGFEFERQACKNVNLENEETREAAKELEVQ